MFTYSFALKTPKELGESTNEICGLQQTTGDCLCMALKETISPTLTSEKKLPKLLFLNSLFQNKKI
jgi:hypothetical protein